MTPEKYAKIESERMEGAKTAQSKTVYKANEPRGYPSGKCQREAANEVSTRETNERKEMYGKNVFERDRKSVVYGNNVHLRGGGVDY